MVVDNSNWFFDIFSWEHLASVATVFTILVSTAFIPVWHMFKKRKAEKEKALDERETAKIKSISEEIIKPVFNKLNEHDEVVRELKTSSLQNDKNTRDTLSTIRALVSEFHSYKDQQHKINAKLYFLDGAFRSGSNTGGLPGGNRPENNPAYRDWRIINREPNDPEESYYYNNNGSDNTNNGNHDE